MRDRASIIFQVFAGTLLLLCLDAVNAKAADKAVRVGVVNGLARGGFWENAVAACEQQTGLAVQTTSGQRDEVVEAFKKGLLDAAVMHTGGSAGELTGEGWGTNAQAWAMNEYVLIGPGSDPAHVKGMTNGVEAIRKIGKKKSRLVNSAGPGGREIISLLLSRANVLENEKWLVPDESEGVGMVAFAETNKAYAVVSRSPKLLENLKPSRMKVMVENDPVMRREFIVIEANPTKLPSGNVATAHALAEFLVSDKFQNNLTNFSKLEGAERPFLFPIKSKQSR